jgi:hypothetical protein
MELFANTRQQMGYIQVPISFGCGGWLSLLCAKCGLLSANGARVESVDDKGDTLKTGEMGLDLWEHKQRDWF